MIGIILELLKITECDGKYSKLAMGKNKYPESINEVYHQFKNELKWQRK